MNNKYSTYIILLIAMVALAAFSAGPSGAQGQKVEKDDTGTASGVDAGLSAALPNYAEDLAADFELIHSSSGGFVVRDKNPAASAYSELIVRVTDSATNSVEFDIPKASLPFFIREIKSSPENYTVTVLAYDSASQKKAPVKTLSGRSFKMCGKLASDAAHARSWAEGDLVCGGSYSWQAPVGAFWEIQKVAKLGTDFIVIAGENTAQAKIDVMTAEFERFKTIRDKNDGIFGTPTDTDGDPRLILTVTATPGAGGFFSPGNTRKSYEEDNANGDKFSSKMDVIHFAADSVDGADKEFMFSVFAHEYQHMTHFHKDADELSFVNEGMSVLAEDINGIYSLKRLIAPAFDTFVKQRINFLSTYNTATGALDNGRYGMCYLFARFFYEGFSSAQVTAVVASAADDLPSYASYMDLFRDFCVAMMINDKEKCSWPNKYGFNSENIALTCASEEIKFNSASPKLEKAFDLHNASANFFGVVYDKPSGVAAAKEFFAPVTITLEDSGNGGIDEFDAVAVVYKKNPEGKEEYEVRRLPKKTDRSGTAIAEDTFADFGDKVTRIGLACAKYKFSEHDTTRDATGLGYTNDENLKSSFRLSVANAEGLAVTKPANGDAIGGRKNDLEAVVISPDTVARTKKVKFYYRDISGVASIDRLLERPDCLTHFNEAAEAAPAGNIATANLDASSASFVHGRKYLIIAVGLDENGKETARSVTLKNGTATGKVVVEADKKCEVSIDSPSNNAEFGEPEIIVSGSVTDLDPVSATLNGQAVKLECKKIVKGKKNRFTFSSKQKLSEGSNPFVLEGRDKFDNIGKHKIIVKYKKKKDEKKKPDKKPSDVKHGDPTFIQIDREDE